MAASQTAVVKSVNIGGGSVLGPPRPGALSGIDKRSVRQIDVRDPGDMATGMGSGAVGDVIIEREDHGGERQALYLVAAEELAYWSAEVGRELTPGSFGENITTEGIDVDALVIGSAVHIGDVHLEVCGPRIPCSTFAAHLGERGWVKRFTARGRPGTYCAVRTPGTLRAGDAITVTSVPAHGIDIMRVFAAHSGDLDAGQAVLASGCLVDADHVTLQERVTRRTEANARQS